MKKVSSQAAAQAYIDVIPKVAALLDETEGDEKTGVQIVLKALEEPAWQIAKNAGLEGAVIVDKVKNCPVAKDTTLLQAYTATCSQWVLLTRKGNKKRTSECCISCFNGTYNRKRCADKPEPPAPAAPMDPFNGRNVLIE